MKFSELELHPSLLGAIEKLNYDEATPVQAATMPHLLEGRDIAGLAQTGTGKTAAFLLPLMERILRAGTPIENLTPEQSEKFGKRAFPDWKNGQCILVLVPTRELCEQVFENCLKLKGDSHIRAVSIYGGVSYDKQKQGLRDGVEFIIATPGRLIDLYKENLVDLKQVRAIVFDEADRMFDMGFKEDMKFILQRVPKERQFLVFSATLNLDVLNTAYQFGANPVEVNVSRDQAKAENVEDKIFHVGQDEKAMYLLTLIKKHAPRQAIIFSNFKMNVPRITQFLNDNKVPAVGISSLLTQAQRTRVMEQFKGDNDRNILVATDVAARGLDIKGVDMVINYELPEDAENYVHRIGRTGRAGEKGKAFSLVSDRDVESLGRIEDYLKHKVVADWMDDADLVKEFSRMPSDRGDRRGPREGGRSEGGRGEGRDRSGGRGESRGPRDAGRGEGGRADNSRPERSAGGRGPRDAARGEGGRGPRDGNREGGRGRGGRDHDRQRAPVAAGAEGQSSVGEAGAAPERPQHRDRALGRHRSGNPANDVAPQGREPRNARGEGRGGRGDQGRRERGEGRPDTRGGRGSDSRPERGNGRAQSAGAPRHPGQGGGRGRDITPKSATAAAQTAPSKSIGQKVSGFFKKLFGQ